MKKKTPPVDIRKVIRAAAEAALEEPEAGAKPKRRRLSSGRALILGAGFVTVGRLLASGRGTDLLGSLSDRLADLGVELPGQDVDHSDTGEAEDVEEPELDELDDAEEPVDDLAQEEDVGDEHESNGGAPERERPRGRRSRT